MEELAAQRWNSCAGGGRREGGEGPRESRLRECLRLRPSKVEVLLERFGEYEGAGTSVSERTREGERDMSEEDGDGEGTYIHSDARERRRSDVERNERNGRDGRREKEMRRGGMRTGMKGKNRRGRTSAVNERGREGRGTRRKRTEEVLRERIAAYYGRRLNRRCH